MKASLDGVILPADSGASWSLISGVAPFRADFEMEANSVHALLDGAVPHGSSVSFTDDEEGVFQADGLTILGSAPTTSPFMERVTVVDLRWEWPRKWVKRSYNVRRRTGTTKKITPGKNPANLQADEDYHPWSLKGGKTPWTATEVLQDVMTAIGPAGGFSLRITGVSLPVVEGLEIDSPGDVALGRVLSEFGGLAGVYITPGGQAIVYDKFDGEEASLVGVDTGKRTRTAAESTALPLVHGYPVWAMQDRSMERPIAVRVLFTRAVELRFDADEKATASGSTTVNDLRCENVLPIPEDATLGTPPSAVSLASWVTLEDYLAFLATQATPAGGKLPALTLDILNRAWLHSTLEVYGMLDPSGLWARRVAAIRTHYRRTYRVSRLYAERIREFSSRRVKLQDVESHGFQVAPAYFDYAMWTTWRATNANKAADGPDPQETVVNRFANPASSPNNIISSRLFKTDGAKVLDEAPATVSMVDAELGIFSVDFYPDVSARAVNYLHSALVTMPSDDPTSKRPWLQDGHLARDREFSCILSAVPQAPNDSRQFYAVTLNAKSPGVSSLGAAGQANLKEGKGPIIEVRVDPGVAMARFGWDQSNQPAIVQYFKASVNPPAEGVDTKAFGDPLNADELVAVANNKAKAIYARFVDHVEGGATTSLRPDLELKGIAREIRHAAGSDGLLTTVSLPEQPPEIDLSQLMPASVRRLIDRGGDA